MLVILTGKNCDFFFSFKELKNHHYFDGIEWENVANRECEPPFAPPAIQLNEENQRDLDEVLGYGVDHELSEAVVEKFRGKFKRIATI